MGEAQLKSYLKMINMNEQIHTMTLTNQTFSRTNVKLLTVKNDENCRILKTKCLYYLFLIHVTFT